MAKKQQPKKGKVKKASKSETAPPDAANHVGEIWHKPFSYTFKGHEVKVGGHWERKAGAGPRPKQPKAAKPKAAKKEKPKKQGKSHWAKVVAKGGEIEGAPGRIDSEGRFIPEPPVGAMTFARATKQVAVGKDHHEAEQAASAGLAKLKAAQQKPVAVPPATTEA